MEDATYKGVGKKERRRMVKRWKQEGQPSGLSLRAWASQQHPVADSAYAWFMAKTRKGASHEGSRCSSG